MRRMRGSPVVVCLAALCAATVPIGAQVPEDLVKQGRALVGQGKHDEAVALYRQAIKAAPQSFDARLAMGIVLDLQGQYAEARTHLAEAIRRAPVVGVRNQALTAMAISYAFESRAADALKYLEPVFRQQLSDQDVSGAAATANAIGRLFLETGDVATARKWYEQGQQLARKVPALAESERSLWELRWLHAAARLAVREGKVDEARRQVAAFEQEMQKRGKPAEDNEIYRYLLGYVSYYAKEYDRAVVELAKGNLADPFMANLLAMAYEAKGETQNARQYYRRTLELHAHSLQNAFARPYARAKLAGSSF
jgi:tetratricopeptide (TPR) repeat protein